ncbi:hypothetical protein MRX96_018871 [Rhipicephalus microplus]
MHKVCGGTRPARHHRKPWWDKEVTAAWNARREANRSRRRAVKTKDAVQTDVAWQRYLQFKRDMQALVQAKLARFNALFLQKLKAEGGNAAQKFWNCVRTLDRSEAVCTVHCRQQRQPYPGHEGGLDGAPRGSVWFTGVHEGPPVRMKETPSINPVWLIED